MKDFRFVGKITFLNERFTKIDCITRTQEDIKLDGINLLDITYTKEQNPDKFKFPLRSIDGAGYTLGENPQQFRVIGL